MAGQRSNDGSLVSPLDGDGLATLVARIRAAAVAAAALHGMQADDAAGAVSQHDVPVSSVRGTGVSSGIAEPMERPRCAISERHVACDSSVRAGRLRHAHPPVLISFTDALNRLRAASVGGDAA